MSSFFSQVTTSYAEVPTEPGIDTVKFLAASEDLVKLFDFLGGTAFAPVKSDMTGNIKYNTNPSKYATLQSIVLDEASGGKKVATEGLMWLRRGLEFTSQALRRNIDDPKEELNVSFNKSYENTLQKHHNMFVRPVFNLAMRAVPYRNDFYKKIGGGDEADAIEKMKPWLSGLEKCVKILVDFYTTGKHEF